MRIYMLLFLIVTFCNSGGFLSAEDRVLKRNLKIITHSNNIAARKRAIDEITHGGDDDERMQALIDAARFKYIYEHALKALAIRTGCKPGTEGGTYANTSGAWAQWWAWKKNIKSKTERSGSADSASLLKRFKTILAGNNFVEKKKIVAEIARGGNDADRMPLLIQAAHDRQVRDAALLALQQRTGLRPSVISGDNRGYPGFPKVNSASGWDEWWKMKVTLQVRIKPGSQDRGLDIKKKEREEDKPILVAEKKKSEVRGLGKIDRVIFKQGGMLMCYIMKRNIDAEGKLLSIDIIHKSSSDKENISAQLIDEINENVR
ncbi:MAG: hypothetical protein HRU15_13145 [Planctomycetes bacterium]|nr:hypothetical protein [Planctomycetota bacterium]